MSPGFFMPKDPVWGTPFRGTSRYPHAVAPKQVCKDSNHSMRPTESGAYVREVEWVM
jgi:hypothetical protein